MTILAHLTDLHLLERDHHKRRGLSRTRLQFLSAGAALDAEARLQRATRMLQLARRGGADHILLTGDLTEDGVDSQFEMLGEALNASGVEPERVTLLPGNHDAYVDFTAFDRALAGPLQAYRATSREGARTVLPGAVIVPISTTVEGQWFTRSRGAIRAHDVSRIRRIASDPVSRDRAVVVAQHHPPSHHPLFAVEWFDGVDNVDAIRDVLNERARVHVLHGHTHRRSTKHLSGREHAQIFCAASVRDQQDTTELSLRFYKAEAGALRELQVIFATPQRHTSVRDARAGLTLCPLPL
ncbi:MAG TPA: metallophosphoesterase [Polyangiales bacterium]|nr:metallophosphoesterase [Polyangiales bacterium]